ncbi:hypothetical protein BH23ACT6_BH23ACT6_18980 [soil metagenome]
MGSDPGDVGGEEVDAVPVEASSGAVTDSRCAASPEPRTRRNDAPTGVGEENQVMGD